MRRVIAAFLLLIAFALPVSAANVFVSTVVIGMSTRAGGDYTFSAVTVPTGVVGLQLMMDVSEATDPLPTLSASLEGSLDGGVTWGPAGAFSRSSRARGFTPGGLPVTQVGATFIGGDFWNDASNPNRRLRGAATLGGTMRFAMTVQPL